MSKVHKQHVTPNPTLGQMFSEVLQSISETVLVPLDHLFYAVPRELHGALAQRIEKKRNQVRGIKAVEVKPKIVAALCADGTPEGAEILGVLRHYRTQAGLRIVADEVAPFKSGGQTFRPALPEGKLADLIGYDGLQGMTLRGVNGSATDFGGMDLKTTKFEGCNLDGARFENAEVDGTVFDPNTTLANTQWVGAQGRPAAINYRTMNEDTYLEFRMRGITTDGDLVALAKVHAAPDELFDQPIERLRLWAEAGLANMAGLTSTGKRVAAIAAEAAAA